MESRKDLEARSETKECMRNDDLFLPFDVYLLQIPASEHKMIFAEYRYRHQEMCRTTTSDRSDSKIYSRESAAQRIEAGQHR